MEDGPVTDRYVVADEAAVIIRHMTNSQVLNVGMVADADPVDIAAQDGAKPDARLFTNRHVANQLGAWRQINSRADLGPLAEILDKIIHVTGI